MFLKYIGKLFARAADGTVLLTDRLTILLVPFATLALWAVGAKMTTSLQEALLLGVAITVLSVVALRLVAASYFLWKDDQSEKARLNVRLDQELSRPDRLERDAAHAYAIGLRNELGDVLAKSIACAEIVSFTDNDTELKRRVLADYADNTIRTRQLANALSYDVPLRISAYELSRLASQLVLDGKKGSAEDWSKLHSLKKLVFRLIHKKDANDHVELLTMLEVQNLVESTHGASDEIWDEVREMIKDPEMLHKLRGNLELKNPNGVEAL
jgi:hypothetical protein